jgi:hypothetical protein
MYLSLCLCHIRNNKKSNQNSVNVGQSIEDLMRKKNNLKGMMYNKSAVQHRVV